MAYPVMSREQIPDAVLKKEDVLPDAGLKQLRQEQLCKAAKQNRLFYSKARIVFETSDGIREVHANIWEVTDKNVMLKGGINIPVCCILEVLVESGN